MANQYFFDNKVVKLPGAYSTIVSGEQSEPISLDFGKTLVIDTGVEGSKWGGGSGVNGEQASGKDAIYTFNDLSEYQNYVKGGLFWKCADALFKPDKKNGATGVSTVLHARAATTTKASMTFTATGEDGNGGIFKVNTVDEGVYANGQVDETKSTSTATVTDFGATGSVFTIAVGSDTLATYTVTASDTGISDVINGLELSMNQLGVSDVISTTSSSISFTPLAGTSPSTATPTLTATGGTASFDTAVAFSGGVAGTDLVKGYGYTVETGVQDSAKWIMKFYVGTYKGLHTDSIPYDEIDVAVSIPKLTVQSPEFDNIQTLIDWANENSDFGVYFKLDGTSAVSGTGAVDATDVASISGYELAIGGTEVFSLENLNLIFDAVADEDFSFIFIDQYGSNYNSSYIADTISFINGDSRFKRFLYVGAGSGESEFTTSITAAQYFNSAYVNVIHDSVKLASDKTASGYRTFPSMYHSAIYVGRTAGKQPQVPLEGKTLGVDGVTHSLTLKQQERAMDSGLNVTVWSKSISAFVNLSDLTSLQDNTRLFTPQGKSYSIQYMRIVEQINKELVINAKIDLLSDENGVNVNTLSANVVKNWTKAYLRSRLATPTADGLLLQFKDVTVTKNGTAWNVSYGIVPNNKISNLFFTGFLFK